MALGFKVHGLDSYYRRSFFQSAAFQWTRSCSLNIVRLLYENVCTYQILNRQSGHQGQPFARQFSINCIGRSIQPSRIYCWVNKKTKWKRLFQFRFSILLEPNCLPLDAQILMVNSTTNGLLITWTVCAFKDHNRRFSQISIFGKFFLLYPHGHYRWFYDPVFCLT